MKNKRQTGSFLSPKEKKTITEIASKDSTLSGKRARTLLLIDEGETHVGAADKTGLTPRIYICKPSEGVTVEEL